MCLQGAVEYGYEFAPVAGTINLFVRMPRPPYGFVEVSVADEQLGSRAKQQKDCFNIRKQNIYLRTAVFQGRRKALSISKKFLK